MALFHRLQKVDQLAGPAAGHRRQLRGLGDAANQIQVVAALRPVPQLAGRQHFPHPQPRHRLGKFHRIHARRRAPAINVHLALGRQLGIAVGIDRQHDCAAPELLHRRLHEIRLAEGRGRNAHLRRPRRQRRLHVCQAPDPPAHRHGNLHGFGHPPQHVEHRPALLHRRRDVQKPQLVRPGRLVGRRAGHRIARINQIHKMDPLHHPAAADVQARHDRDGFFHGKRLSMEEAFIISEPTPEKQGEPAGDHARKPSGATCRPAAPCAIC
jgi:hypothetical protein